MKKFASVVVFCLMFIVGWMTMDLVRDAFRREVKNEKSLSEIHEDIEEIYKLISANNSTQGNILDHHGRLLHYVAGHDFRHFVQGCPECGLLDELNRRKSELSDTIHDLAEWLENNKQDPKFEDMKAKLIGLSEELNLVSKHIYNADDRAKKIGELMMKRIQEENAQKE